MTKVTPLSLVVTCDISVSAMVTVPKAAHACLVFAHGAGAGMNHPFIANLCDGLAIRGIATLRYQFPYMEKGSRRPDPPTPCHTTVHLASVKIPMLFLQGARDALAGISLMQKVVARLQAPVTLKVIHHADHSFHVLVRSGTTDREVMNSMLDEVGRWIAAVCG
jgi:predicted alpha/beta-hydrolase family hydrolase